jgi:hypothetical protein
MPSLNFNKKNIGNTLNGKCVMQDIKHKQTPQVIAYSTFMFKPERKLMIVSAAKLLT